MWDEVGGEAIIKESQNQENGTNSEQVFHSKAGDNNYLLS